jgi:spore maturation protein SpmB
MMIEDDTDLHHRSFETFLPYSTIYITVFYFSAVGIKKYGKVIGIGLVINLIGFILSFLIVYFFL